MKTFIHFLSIMAFITNVDELQAMLPIYYLALKLGYINKTQTHIHKVELKTPYFNFV